MPIPLETPAKGRLLIAEPFLGDPGFERSVVLLTDYTTDGAVGFVLNRPMDLRMEQVLDNFPEYKPQIYFGGPVQQNNLYYLHRRGDLIVDSQEVLPGLFWGGKINAVKEMLGHSNLSATQIYTHTSMDKIQKVYRQAHPRS